MNRRIRVTVLLTGLLLFLSSCDLFFGLPKGRENPADEMAQLTYPRVAAFSPDSVWLSATWKDAMRWMDSDKQIQEALVVWSTDGFLLSPSDPARLFPAYEEETLSGPGTVSRKVSGLSPGDTVYVSFFGKMERGGWLQPLMRKATVSAGSFTQLTSGAFINRYRVDKSIPEATTAGTSETISSTLLLALEMQTGIPAEAVIVSAELNLGTAYDGLTVRVSPITRYWDGYDYYHLMDNNLIGYSSASTETGSATDFYVTVDSAVRAAHNSGTNMLIIDMPYTGETLPLNIGSIALDIYYAMP